MRIQTKIIDNDFMLIVLNNSALKLVLKRFLWTKPQFT